MKKKSESEMSGLFFWTNQASHASAWFEGESEGTGSYWNNDVTVLASVRPDVPLGGLGGLLFPLREVIPPTSPLKGRLRRAQT